MSSKSAPFIAAFMLFTLGACSSTKAASEGGARRMVSVPAPMLAAQAASVATDGFRTPRVMKVPGLEGVIGADAARLQRLFGEPRLDVTEGDAKKLQFRGEACVLDIYLYPMQRGAKPQATYVDARRASDGLDVDRASCVAALRAAVGSAGAR